MPFLACTFVFLQKHQMHRHIMHCQWGPQHFLYPVTGGLSTFCTLSLGAQHFLYPVTGGLSTFCTLSLGAQHFLYPVTGGLSTFCTLSLGAQHFLYRHWKPQRFVYPVPQGPSTFCTPLMSHWVSQIPADLASRCAARLKSVSGFGAE